MNLPLILDITLGLIFIYLSLSLLAAEIQEMMATLFQWRAQHLRKSIEILLAGDVSESEEANVIQLANTIYSNPLIKSLNQEAKGFLATLPRRLTWLFAGVYRLLKRPRAGMNQNESFFGEQQRSAPSYIPGESFASSLIDTLHLPDLVQNLIESRLELFKDERLAEIKQVLDKLSQENNLDEEFKIFLNNANLEFIQLQTDLDRSISNFEQNKATLHGTINSLANSVDIYIDNLQLNREENELSNRAIFRLKSLRKDMFNDVEQTILLAGLKPNLNEVVQLMNTSSNVYQEASGFLKAKDSSTHQKIQNVIQKLPPSLSHNLIVLAQGVQTKVINTEEGIVELRRHLENSFDRSMDRASGVYKRNSKGVALLIGFILALGVNADAFHMVNRLSKDSALRQTVTENASNVLRNNNVVSNSNILTNDSQGNPQTSPDIETRLKQIKNSTDVVLTDVSLPVGWTDTNLKRQLNSETGKSNAFSVLDLSPRKIIRWTFIFMGWVVSGIAISMGAPFWFDLINRIVNVRNTGKIPK